jgi:hypothetical protein
VPGALQESERITDVTQWESSIDYGFDSRRLDPAHHVDLMLTTADDQSQQPLLPSHQRGCGNDTPDAG